MFNNFCSKIMQFMK